ncbi:glycosyltransferase WbuB [Kocuria soli]|uniref:Glycosyltransferase WbuB n=1 Tax=Kocuria soli TaxID=2485125 RepID=A0A3N3ZQ55_9MICC|nr:glycosyltransferase [Kocuria soli]ROZ63281.1 glycosyltransferase WbuB [Kocuria soli]
MRILIIGLNYAPEPTGNAPYTTALARGLVERGHTVTVLTGYPHYPEWRIAEGYTGRRQTELIDGVRVHRFRHMVPSQGGTGAARLLMELHFGLRAAFSRWPHSDVVLTVSPALFSSGIALVRARLTGRSGRAIWVQDLYSKGAEELNGSVRRSRRLLKWLEGKVLGQAQSVAVIHPRFAAHVIESLGFPSQGVVVHRNWSHLRTVSSPVDRAAVRAKHGWGDGDRIILHAGNMGAKQDLENVVEAARRAQVQGSSVHFVLLGSGSRRAALEELGQGVENLHFLPPQDDRRFQEILHSADALLVNEQPGLREMAVPSKLTSYFRTGLPVLAAVEPDGTTAQEVLEARAGVVVPPGDPSLLLQAAQDLTADAVRCQALGANGLRHAEENLTQSSALARNEAWLRQLAVRPSSRAERSRSFGTNMPRTSKQQRTEPEAARATKAGEILQ